MARNITALGGQESQANQFPVSLVSMPLNSGTSYGPLYMNDSDIDLWMNISTGAVSATEVAGYTKFSPFADLTVPTISLSNSPVLANLAITASNVNEEWYGILSEDKYRDSVVTVYQGMLKFTTEGNPETLTFVGQVTMYIGRINYITANYQTGTINVLPHVTPWWIQVPYRLFTPEEYPHLPPQGKTVTWGYTTKTL
jgi:hypothetical protein